MSRGRGARSEFSNPVTSFTVARVRILNSSISWSCASRNLILIFYEAGKLQCQFTNFRVVTVESQRPRSGSWPSERKQHTRQVLELPSAENLLSLQITWNPFFFTLSLSLNKMSWRMPDLHYSGFPIWRHWEVKSFRLSPVMQLSW